MSTCLAKGFGLAGAEYGGECYCGNAYTGGASVADDQCGMSCRGNGLQTCGAGGRLTTFNYTLGIAATAATSPPGWASVGCMSDTQTVRALAGHAFTSGAMTQELCTTTCLAKGFTVAGGEYAGECYCGNAFTPGTTPTTDCAMPCKGNCTQVCGGVGRMSAWNYTAGIEAPSLPSGWVASGCMTDAGPKRALGGYSFSSSAMTRELCMSRCVAKGFPLAGMEYASECFCGSAYAPDSTSSSGCTMACSGNSTQICGGPNRLTAYRYTVDIPSTSTTSAAPTATALNVTIPTGWQYIGCVTEGTSGRALGGYSTSAGNLTNEMCMAACQTKGYTLAGTEYSGECFCGNAIGAGSVASTACTMKCNGNSTQVCGGPNLLSTWQFGGAVSSASTSSKQVTSVTTIATTSTSPTFAPTTSSAISTVTTATLATSTRGTTTGTSATAPGKSAVSSNSTTVATAKKGKRRMATHIRMKRN